MPCGCFGGGTKKKGSPRNSEPPPKPPKLLEEIPIKQDAASPVYTSQPESQTDSPGKQGNGQLANSTAVNGSPVTTPISTSLSLDAGSTRSSGARSRAELYAKRREFFKPLYDVSLSATPNQKFGTPRTANTLPARGKKGGFVLGDETGYFTADGKFFSADGHTDTSHHQRDVLSSDGGSIEDSSLTLPSEGQLVENEEKGNSDRPTRPTSQPSGPAGQWDDIMDGRSTPEQPKDEFHQKHQQILSHASPTVPLPPPPPKEMNPHFVEFQEKHHKIVRDPDHENKDPKITQRIVEKRLTELDKLHNEVQDHYEKRMKHGPVDVDSLVEKYTEDRWRKMVEMWEAEGLVVEGGMVVVDEQGNIVQREISPVRESTFSKVQNVTESEGPKCEKVVEHFENGGEKVVRVTETRKEVSENEDGVTVVKHTETVMVEKMVENSEPTPKTVITPPTPQPAVDEPSLTKSRVEEPPEEYENEILKEQYDDNIVEINSDDDMQHSNGDHVNEKQDYNHDHELSEQILSDPSSYRVSPPPSPPLPKSSQTPPQTCTPPPSPQRERSPQVQEDAKDMTTIGSSAGCGREQSATASATPPPSPPIGASND